MNGNIKDDGNVLGSKRFYTDKDTFDKDQVWVHIPREGGTLLSGAVLCVGNIDSY